MATYLARKSKPMTLALLLAFSVVPASWASPAGAAAAASGGAMTADPANATATAPSTSSPAQPAAMPASAASSTEVALQELRELLEAQSQQLQAQSQQLQEQHEKMLELEAALVAATPGLPVDAVAAAVVPVPGSPAAQQQDIETRLERIESTMKGFGPFTFAGDFRLRDEPYFGGPVNQSQVRDRERYRARFYINAKLNDDISGGLALASGDINDPISTNQTANQDFTRKPFYLDKAFINYNPHQFKALTLVGGKFADPFYSTELTWDKDISPEGVAEKLEWKSDNWTVLRQFALIGFELPFGESTKADPVTTFTSNAPNALLPYPNASIKQSVVYGGQIQTRWQLASWISFTADTAFYDWHNADQVALANQVAYYASGESSPGLGLMKLNNTLTNSYQIATESYVVPVSTTNGTACVVGTPSGNKCTTTLGSYVIGAKLNSKFALSDTIAQFDIKTPSDRWPVRFLADYVQNTEACANHPGTLPLSAAELATLPVDATVTQATKNGNCDEHDRRGTWLEARFGRQQERGDWQFAYTHMLIDQEAVLSLFDFSDMRQGSNVQENRVEAFYQVHKNVQLAFTGLFGRPLDTPNTVETELKRLQFDVIYKF